MNRLMLAAAVLACYIVAAYVSEFVFYQIIIASDPLRGAAPGASLNWSLFPWAPLLIPVRYLFVTYSTFAGGRESLSQTRYAAQCLVFVVAFVASWLAYCGSVVFLTRR
jgi:hypothetical protein